MATSASPASIALAHSRKAWSDETQATEQVKAGQLSGSCVPNTTSRPRLEVAGSAITVPITRRSTAEGSILVLLISPETAMRPRSYDRRSVKAVPDRQKGVRAPSMNTTRRFREGEPMDYLPARVLQIPRTRATFAVGAMGRGQRRKAEWSRRDFSARSFFGLRLRLRPHRSLGRNDVMTGWPWQPSQHVVPSEGVKRANRGISRRYRAAEISPLAHSSLGRNDKCFREP